MFRGRIWPTALLASALSSTSRRPFASLLQWSARTNAVCAVGYHSVAPSSPGPFIYKDRGSIPIRLCLNCGRRLGFTGVTNKKKYCSKLCATAPKSLARALPELFAEMLEQRKSTQDRPIVLCSDVGMRIQELKTQGSWPKSNRKRWQLETSIKGAAKRMVLREEVSRGLVVTGVDRFGREVHVESVQGDWGLRLDGKKEPVRDDAKS